MKTHATSVLFILLLAFAAWADFHPLQLQGGVSGAVTAVESGTGTTAGIDGTLAVTFSTAFTSTPDCYCMDVNASPGGCGNKSTADSTQTTFRITSNRADTIYWTCYGTK